MIECNKPPQYHIAHINAALVHIALQYRYRTSRVVAITHIYIHRSTHSQPYVSMAHMLHNPDPTESLRQLPSIIPTFVEPMTRQKNTAKIEEISLKKAPPKKKNSTVPTDVPPYPQE